MFRAIILFFLLVFSQMLRAQVVLPDTMSLDEAFTYYRELTEKNPRAAYANLGLAECYFAAGDYAKSQKISSRFMNSDNVLQQDFHLLYAQSLDAREFPEKALKHLKKYNAQFPDDYRFYYLRAWSAYKIQNFDELKRSSLQYITLNRNFVAGNLLQSMYLYESNNDPYAAVYAVYALFLSSSSPSANSYYRYLSSLIQGNHLDIAIPIKDQRYKLLNVDETIMYYVKRNANQSHKLSPSVFVLTLSAYLQKTFAGEKIPDVLDVFYGKFFRSMMEQGHLEAFCWYLARAAGGREPIDWMVKNPQKLSAFSDFLEKADW